MTGIDGFVVKWSAEDVVNAAGWNGWDITLDAARNWLAEHQRVIMERMTEDGNEMFRCMTQCVDDWSKYENKKMPSTTRVLEGIYYITLVAAKLACERKISAESSTILFPDIDRLANEFGEKWESDGLGGRGADYKSSVMEYAEKKLLEQFGVSK